jgi:glycosyltransferase involved in cell wall biosynthesis
MPGVLWWGRFDPEYSRNRIVRSLFLELGWTVRAHRPRWSWLGDLEAALRHLPSPELVWVPCFRHRDLAAASRWAHRRGVPLVADPLISAYDKQTEERAKLLPGSARARRLLRWETDLLGRADRVVADTPAHAEYFARTLGVPACRLRVLHVGAEEDLFPPTPLPQSVPGEPIQALFFGSFIPLQGPQVIAAAAACYRGPPVRWCLVGDGPLLPACRDLAAGSANVRFEPWVPYPRLAGRIHRADILLGIFGSTPKARRVIPNKVYQALACARPVVTLRAVSAYPPELADSSEQGLVWVAPGDPSGLAAAVAQLAADRTLRHFQADQARKTYERHFSRHQLRYELAAVLDGLSPSRPAPG